MDDPENLNIAIIGGGYAGMAAAVKLAARGIAVTVFESARQLGGRARGVEYQNLQLDNGQHLLLGCYQQTLKLIEQVGGNLTEDFLRLPLQLDLHGHFKLKSAHLPAPLHLFIALLRAQGINWTERYQAVRLMMHLRQIKFSLTQDMTAINFLNLEGQSPALIQKLWEPLCIAALNTPVRIASAQVLLNVLRDALNQTRADSDMLIPRINFSALFPERAAHYIKKRGAHVLTSCGVSALDVLNDGVKITTKRGQLFYSHVICATQATSAAKLLHPVSGLTRVLTQIDALTHQPIYTLYLQYPPFVTLPQPMLGLHQRMSQWLFDQGQISGKAGLIACVISAAGIHQNLSQDALANAVIDELAEEFGLIVRPRWFKVIAEKRATFACTANLLRPSQQTPLPRVLLAGDYTRGDYPATLEGAVQSGIMCAQLIGVTSAERYLQ